jgi:flagellar basal body P-ring protein FlgI
VVLFGAPLECKNDIFVESPDQTIVVNARQGQDHISLTRKHPTRSGIMGPIRAGFEVGSIVRVLGNDATASAGGQLQGLGVSYADIIAILQQLSARDAVDAEFLAGPLPKVGHTVKK